MNANTLDRDTIREIFRRHEYSQRDMAQEYGCFESAVSQWFAGLSKSAPMEAFARDKALAFLKSEHKEN